MESTRSKQCPEINRESYNKLISDLLGFGCKKCGGKTKQCGRRIVKCLSCGTKWKPKGITNLNKIFIDMSDSKNWKSQCPECGGTMDYYNCVYGCRKCGSHLEV